MKNSLKTAGLAAIGIVALPALAAAQTFAAATTDLNVRAGPSAQHQVVGVIPGGEGAVIHECTPAMTWCQLSYGNVTGWSYAGYLTTDAMVAHGGAVVPGTPPYAEMGVASPAPTGAPIAGIGAGAVAGGLIGGPPGALIGAGAGAVAGGLATPRRAHAHPHGTTVAVAGPHPHHAHQPRRVGAGLGAHAGIGAGALTGALIGGPPGAVIGGVAGGILAGGAAGSHVGSPYHTTR